MTPSCLTRARAAIAFGLMALFCASCLVVATGSGAAPRVVTAEDVALAMAADGLAAADVAADSASPAPRDTTVAQDLGPLAPSSEPPWNPGQVVTAENPAEAVARVPARVLALPFTLLGQIVEGGLLFVEEVNAVPRVTVRLAQLQHLGITLGAAGLGDRVGWAAGAGYSPPAFPFLKMFGAASTSEYYRTNFALMRDGTGIAYQFDWRPRAAFHGIGRLSSHDDVANYAQKVEAVTARLDWSTKPPPLDPHVVFYDPAEERREDVPMRREVWAWAGPRDVRLSYGRDPKRPSLEETFPVLAPQLGPKVEHFVYGAHIGVDTREGRPHWSRGWRLAAEAERFDKAIPAFALDDAGTPAMPFTRLMYEVEAGWSFYKDPRTLRFYGRVQDLRSFSNEGMFLISDLSRLGGSSGLYGFDVGRFHDVDLIVGRLNYIVPLMRYLEVDFHGELGSVYRRLEDARMDTMEHSLGFAFRIRSAQAPMISVGVDFSRELARFRFAFGGIE